MHPTPFRCATYGNQNEATVLTSPLALVYCRVSTRRQEDEGTSLDTQEAACVKHAESLGYTVGRITREVYSGAELWDRPALAQDRTDLRTKQFGALIAYSTDRLSRKPTHLAIIAEECERAGVELVFVTEPLDNTPEGALIRYVKGYAADIEREKIRERNMRGKHAHVRAGNAQTWGFPPLGYRTERQIDPENPSGRPRTVRVIDEDEAALIRRIFRMVADQGLSLSEVVDRLNAEGIPSPGSDRYGRRGPDWSPRWGLSQVSRIIHRPDYKGLCYALTTELGAGGKRVPRKRDEWVELPEGVSPAIVDADLWEKAQAVAARNRTAKSRNAQRPYLLRGRIFCGVCGKPMRSTPDHARFIYRCSSRETPGEKCSGTPVPAGDTIPKGGQPRGDGGRLLPVDPAERAALQTIPGVDTAVWRHVATTLQNPELIASEIERRRRTGPDPALQEDLATTQRLYAQVEAKQQRLLRRYSEATDDSFPWELVQGEVGRLEKEKAALAETTAELEERMRRQAASTARLEELSRYCERVAENLETFAFEERRMAIEALGVTVTGSGREAWIHYAIPELGPDGKPVTGNSFPLFENSAAQARGQLRPRRGRSPVPRPRSSTLWRALTLSSGQWPDCNRTKALIDLQSVSCKAIKGHKRERCPLVSRSYVSDPQVDPIDSQISDIE